MQEGQRTKKFNIDMGADDVEAVGRAACKRGLTRGRFIRLVLREKLKELGELP